MFNPVEVDEFFASDISIISFRIKTRRRKKNERRCDCRILENCPIQVQTQ
jgi:hypothetical protein